MQLRADEFAVTGKGSAAEAFQRLGLTPEEVKEKLKDPTELLLLLIERTRLLKDTAAGVRIFDELFGGTGGERMVSLIDQGEAGIRRQITAANDFGHVLSDDVIQKAQEIDRQFNTIANTVGNTLKSAIVSVVGSMMDFMEGLRTIENRRSTTIQKSINDIMAQKQEVAKALADIDGADSKLNERQRAKARGTHQEKMRQLNEQENAMIRELENRPEVMNFKPTSNAPWTPPKYTPPPPSNTGGSNSSVTEARAQRERDAVKELIAELEEELRLINASDAAKRAAAASRQAGAAATDDERQKVIALTEAIHREEEARRRSEEQAMFYRDLTRAGLDDLFSALEQGKSFWDAMAEVAVNSLKRIGQSLIDDVLDNLFKINGASGGGGGILGSLFGSIFGGGSSFFPAAPKVGLYATGGVAKEPSIFAEAGPEAAVPLPDGRRIPVDLGNSGGGAVSVSIPISIDATGADAAGLTRVQRQLAQLKADLPAIIVKSVKDAQKRRTV